MAPLVLTADQARRLILDRHGLTRARTPLDAVGSVVAVQTQYAASLPIAVTARGAKIKPGWDARTLEAGELVKTWSLRYTLHAHVPDDYRLMIEAFGGEGPRGGHTSWMVRCRGFGHEEWRAIEESILLALEAGPLSRKDLHERVPQLKGIESTGWGIDVMGLALEGRVSLLTPAKGPTLFLRRERPPLERSMEEALAELMRRYLAAYGPATLADFAYWSGMKGGPVKQAFERLGKELREIRVEGMSGVRWMLAGTPVTSECALPSVRLLAKFDPLLMGHRDKTLFLPAEDHARVFRIAGQVEASVLERGVVTGTWRLERVGRRAIVRLHSHRAGFLRNRGALERELSRLARAIGVAELVPVIES